MSDPSRVLLEAVHLTRIYSGPSEPLVIFENLDLKVARGSIAAIIGPSGAGKSTLLHLLGGLDPCVLQPNG